MRIISRSSVVNDQIRKYILTDVGPFDPNSQSVMAHVERVTVTENVLNVMFGICVSEHSLEDVKEYLKHQESRITSDPICLSAISDLSQRIFELDSQLSYSAGTNSQLRYKVIQLERELASRTDEVGRWKKAYRLIRARCARIKRRSLKS